MSPAAAVIKHYQIVSCLGQGGFGKVFEAWDSKLQRSVAIKCLNADGMLSPAADLLREARMAASLNHPAFVKIHALEDDDNSQAIVMELIKGETLKQVIVNQTGVNQARAIQPNGNPSSENQSDENQSRTNQAINIICQIAEAMQQAHALGLTHGDLKPSNIMLEPSGAIRILDFGLASKADLEATTSMLQQDPQGTIAYMAPERLLGAPLAPQIDIYALGVIFYELLTGQRPFAELNGLGLAAALVQSSSDQWHYAQELSPKLIHIIRRMTAKQVAQRLSSMADVLLQLDALENDANPENSAFAENKLPLPEVTIAPESKKRSSKQSRNKQLKSAVLLLPSSSCLRCIRRLDNPQLFM
ncbi:MAG TPA: serine/threonine-protein kinase, partial [Cellvibrio sp.]|nr:serine/threonine-protein kinase [Cellvibrio sp.]